MLPLGVPPREDRGAEKRLLAEVSAHEREVREHVHADLDDVLVRQDGQTHYIRVDQALVDTVSASLPRRARGR